MYLKRSSVKTLERKKVWFVTFQYNNTKGEREEKKKGRQFLKEGNLFPDHIILESVYFFRRKKKHKNEIGNWFWFWLWYQMCVLYQLNSGEWSNKTSYLFFFVSYIYKSEWMERQTQKNKKKRYFITISSRWTKINLFFWIFIRLGLSYLKLNQPVAANSFVTSFEKVGSFFCQKCGLLFACFGFGNPMVSIWKS